MFSFCNYEEPEKNKTCPFREVSPCRDQVSKKICNAHSQLFGITHKLVSYQDGNNDSWSNVEAYISSVASFHLPLFLDTNGEILVSEIHSFALSVANSHPNIKLDVFENVIACLMGISAYSNVCPIGGWLDEPNTNVIVQDNDRVNSFTSLPQLHKILLHYSKPSTIRNTIDNSQIYLVPNLSLTYDLSNSSVATYHFVIPNKKAMLKWTPKIDCVATPIVINAIRIISSQQQTRSFRPFNNSTVAC